MNSPDPFLVALNVGVQKNDVGGLPITISCKGTVISGKLVNLDKFKEHEAEWLGLERDKLDSLGNGTDSDGTEFLHLIDALVCNGPNSWPQGSNCAWRCRLSSVDGFFLGSVRPVEQA